MYTSVTTAQMKAGFRYLTAAILVAAAGWIYELFSHGVYSYYMIYAFMIPLIAGALPNITAAVISNSGSGTGDRSSLNPNPVNRSGLNPNSSDRSSLNPNSVIHSSLNPNSVNRSSLNPNPVIRSSLNSNPSDRSIRNHGGIGGSNTGYSNGSLNTGDRNVSAGLQLAAVITLTAGSLISGVLEIYGTTNRLMIAYPILGTVLLAAWLLTSRRAVRE